MLRRICWPAAALCLVFSANVTIGQEVAPSDPKAVPFLLDQAKAYVIQREGDKQPLELKPEAIFNWTNPERLGHKGTVYIWLVDERPEVIGSLFTYEVRGGVHEKHAFHSLSAKSLESRFAGTVAWTPKAPGVDWKPLDGPAPAATSRLRQSQLRQLAREFQCTLIDPKTGPAELRFLPKPLYEYSSPKTGTLDGAIFAFVIATDPEALLLLEATDRGWQYALARFHYWELIAKRDDKEVWKAPADDQMYNRLGDKVHQVKAYNSYGVGSPKPIEPAK